MDVRYLLKTSHKIRFTEQARWKMLKMHIFYLKFEILRFRSEKLYDDYLYQNVCCILSHDKVKLKFERKPLALTQFF